MVIEDTHLKRCGHFDTVIFVFHQKLTVFLNEIGFCSFTAAINVHVKKTSKQT